MKNLYLYILSVILAFACNRLDRKSGRCCFDNASELPDFFDTYDKLYPDMLKVCRYTDDKKNTLEKFRSCILDNSALIVTMSVVEFKKIIKNISDNTFLDWESITSDKIHRMASGTYYHKGYIINNISPSKIEVSPYHGGGDESGIVVVVLNDKLKLRSTYTIEDRVVRDLGLHNFIPFSQIPSLCAQITTSPNSIWKHYRDRTCECIFRLNPISKELWWKDDGLTIRAQIFKSSISIEEIDNIYIPDTINRSFMPAVLNDKVILYEDNNVYDMVSSEVDSKLKLQILDEKEKKDREDRAVAFNQAGPP